MTSLRRALPPPNSLVTFEAVGRHLSFTRAAGELGVSQAATSRQIRALEDHLGVVLFERAGRRLRLTAAGDELFAAVSMALGHIATTSEGLRRQARGGPLSVAATLAFSALWLMPRLGHFHARHPGRDIRLLSSDSEGDWLSEGIDIAVSYGDGSWPGYITHRLFGEEVIAVAHPGYFADRPWPTDPAQLLRESLLHMEARNPTWLSWHDWLGHWGVAVPRRLHGPSFNSYTIVLQAALDRRGIALGWRRLIGCHLADGALVQVTEAGLVPEQAYHLLTAPGIAGQPLARAFCDWLLEEAAG